MLTFVYKKYKNVWDVVSVGINSYINRFKTKLFDIKQEKQNSNQNSNIIYFELLMKEK